MTASLFQPLQQQIAALESDGLRRHRRCTETPCAPHMRVDGREMLAFCSNDYLGLAAHPEIIEALVEGAHRYGAGSGASHLISGHSCAHARLEAQLAEFMVPHLPSARALTFSTGYLANLALLSALGGARAELFCEALNHASLIDGARLSRSKVSIYAHGDIVELEALLKASTAATRLVVTDSVFSMDGDLAPLPALLALCQQYEAWLVIDDAHGFGVLGESGRGSLEHFGLHSSQIILMGTLGKAAGVAGAFIAAHETVIETLVQKARPYIYTTASPPALAHALSASLMIICGEQGRQRRLHLNNLIAEMNAKLVLQTWRRPHSLTAIQPIIIGSNAAALAVSASLDSQGFWIPAIRPPTVPQGSARLRVTLSAAHTFADLERLIAALHRLESELGIEV